DIDALDDRCGRPESRARIAHESLAQRSGMARNDLVVHRVSTSFRLRRQTTEPGSAMPTPPKLSRKLQETLGNEAGDAMVEWMNQSDANHDDLRQELHADIVELRHEMHVGFADVRAEMRVGFARVDAKFAAAEAA